MHHFNYTISAIKSIPAKGRRNGIKILSLSLGLSVSLVLLTTVCFEQTYDNCFDGSDRIFYVTENAVINEKDISFAMTPGGIAPRMKEYFANVEEASRWRTFSSDTKVILQDNKHNSNAGLVILADSSFFKILGRPCLAGSLVEPLGLKGNAVISSSLAMRLSDSHIPSVAAGEMLGKVFRLEGEETEAEATISGVYEDYPANTSCRPDIVISMSSANMYGLFDSSEGVMANESYTSLVKLTDKSDAGQINEGMGGFIDKYIPREDILDLGIEFSFSTHPYEDFHNGDSYSRNLMLVLSLVALVLLLTAVLNYLLIVLSTSVSRSREMALRKCLGSDTADMYRLMTAESLVHTLLACIVAVVIIYSSRGLVESLSGTAVSDLFKGKPLLIAVATVLLVFLVNAIIPAAMYNRTPVSTVFRNFVAGKRVWKRALLAVEFSAAAFLGVMISIISLQYNKLVTANLGFDCENNAFVEIFGLSSSQKKALMDEIRSIPDVADASYCYQHPFDGYSGNMVSLPGSSESLFNISDARAVDSHWFDVMGINVVRGESFNEDMKDDEEVLIDTRFEQMLKANTGWDDVIGKEIQISNHRDGTDASVISGVFESITQGLIGGDEEFYVTRPMAVFYSNPDLTLSSFNYIIINYHKLDAESVARTRTVLEEIVPDRELETSSFKSVRLEDFQDTLNVRNTILLGSLITLLIAIIGLIGYTIDEIKRRSKEIAVRRINGAQFIDIRRMFIRDIMFIAVPSSIAGCILAAIAARRWEQQFLEQAGLPWLAVALTFISTIALAAIVSDWYVFRIAHSNPADSIKTE